MDIILFYNFNSLIWLTGIVEVVSTCSRQPKLITKNDNNNYNVPFLHVFNWKSNKHKHKQLIFVVAKIALKVAVVTRHNS